MVAVWPSTVTTSSVEVALKPDPLIVTVAPGIIGEVTDVIETELATVVRAKEAGAAPFTVAVNVLGPAVVPVLNLVATRPCASVGATAGDTCPLPAATANVTTSPALGLPNASLTTKRTESPAGAPAETLAGSALVLVTDAEAPATTVTERLALAPPAETVMLAAPTGPGAETTPWLETAAIDGALVVYVIDWPDITEPFVSRTVTESWSVPPAEI